MSSDPGALSSHDDVVQGPGQARPAPPAEPAGREVIHAGNMICDMINDEVLRHELRRRRKRLPLLLERLFLHQSEHDLRAISVPLVRVMMGQPGSPGTARSTWSAPLAAVSSELPKLIVRVRFSSPALIMVSNDTDLLSMSPWRGTPIIEPAAFAAKVDAMRRHARRRR